MGSGLEAGVWRQGGQVGGYSSNPSKKVWWLRQEVSWVRQMGRFKKYSEKKKRNIREVETTGFGIS